MELAFVAYFLHLANASWTDIERTGVKVEFLEASPEASAIYRYMKLFSKNHSGKLPSLSRVKKIFSDTPLEKPSEPLEDIIDTLKLQYYRRQLDITAKLAGETHDPQQVYQQLVKQYQQLLSVESGPKVMAYESAISKDAVADYLNRETNKGLVGYSWPWKPLNDSTAGIVPGYYIVYGLTKTLKTWLVLYIMAHLYENHSVRIGIYSKEMKTAVVVRRLTALLAKVDYRKVIKGELRGEERNRFLRIAKELSSSSPRIFIFNPTAGVGPEDLRLEAKNLGLDVIFVDSAYLMASSKRGPAWTTIASISSELLKLSRDLNIPVFVTTQEHERTAKTLGRKGTASVGYAHKFVEDADMAIHIFRYGNRLGLDFPASREEDIPSFTINARLAYDFSFLHMGIRQPEEEKKLAQKHKKSGLVSVVDELDIEPFVTSVQRAELENDEIN